MDFRQLLPEPGSWTLDTLLASLSFSVPIPADRPYTLVNFISSADGRAAFGGRSGSLGDDGDRAMFHGLREQVDAVLVGTGTLRTERYGRILGKPERRQRRLERDLPPEPIACVVTRTGNVPTDIALFCGAGSPDRDLLAGRDRSERVRGSGRRRPARPGRADDDDGAPAPAI